MEQIINNCTDCLFQWMSGYEGEEYICSIDSEKRFIYKRDFIKHIDEVKLEDDKEWCPLKKENVLVKLNATNFKNNSIDELLSKDEKNAFSIILEDRVRECNGIIGGNFDEEDRKFEQKIKEICLKILEKIYEK